MTRSTARSIYSVSRAVVAKWLGHWPGNHKVPGLMPGIDPYCISLGKKLTLAPVTQLLNWDIVCDLCDRAQLKNSLWLMLSSL